MINNGNNIGGGVPMPTISIDHQIQSGQQRHTSNNNNNNATTTAAAEAPAAGGSSKENQQRGGGPSAAAAATSETPQPAFPGAKHDVNGYCIRHSKIRLCQPVYNNTDDGKKYEHTAGECYFVKQSFGTFSLRGGGLEGRLVCFFWLWVFCCLGIFAFV